MKDKSFVIIENEEKILNLDSDEDGNYILITDNNSVITKDYYLKININLWFPIIRRIDEIRFLIINSTTIDKKNAYIYNFNGQLLKSFYAGDCFEDLIIHNGKIIITYFDEGVFGDEGPNNDGLCIFDFDGNYLFGFNSIIENGYIDDCYCICKYGINSVLFYAYSDFYIYELNLDNFNFIKYETPKDFRGASAISSIDNKIILHSSYEYKRSFFEWNLKTNEVKMFGNYSSELKGIPNGKFITYGEKGFTIISPLEN